MTKSSIFLATATLIGLLLLGLLAISSLPPKVAQTNVNNSGVTPLDAPTVDFGNPSRGGAKASVTIVQFSDYLCSPCGEMAYTLAQILQDFPDDVRVVWKDFPNTALNANALDAAVAARCAGVQGAFWEYHDLLMSNQSSINANAYAVFAGQLGLDPNDFDTCLTQKTTRPIVERDFEEGQRLRITATPSLFVNDRRVVGAVQYETLKNIISSEIDAAKKEAVTAGSENE